MEKHCRPRAARSRAIHLLNERCDAWRFFGLSERTSTSYPVRDICSINPFPGKAFRVLKKEA